MIKPVNPDNQTMIYTPKGKELDRRQDVQSNDLNIYKSYLLEVSTRIDTQLDQCLSPSMLTLSNTGQVETTNSYIVQLKLVRKFKKAKNMQERCSRHCKKVDTAGREIEGT